MQQEEPNNTTEEPADDSSSKQDKVVILFKAVGSTPLLKKTKAKINTNSPFREVIGFIRKQLKMKNDQSLFLYCNQAFCPNPDELVGDLYKTFGSDKMLVISYCNTAAWG
ncbi:autophagy-related protein ATG12 [Acrasis kona]|uniref:Ubiquitin-like protein ATG12 n=1 Tax=Acrasis kona TaxID=1008807 RepID=A0AAW2YRB7_9EUKA